MLQPKKQKYRKYFRGKMKGNARSGFTLSFGEYGLKAQGRAWLKTRQIEAARKAISNFTKRSGKLWIRVFPHKSITSKSAGSPMGQGKGDPSDFVAVVRPGRIIFELSGVEEEIAKIAFRRAGDKLPFKTKFIKSKK